MHIVLLNSGGGPARGTSFLLVIGEARVQGTVGLMESGRRNVIKTREGVSGLEPFAGLVSCFQPDGSVQTLFANEKRKVYRKRLWRWHLPEDEKMFAKMYPDVGLDGKREVPWHYPQLTQP